MFSLITSYSSSWPMVGSKEVQALSGSLSAIGVSICGNFFSGESEAGIACWLPSCQDLKHVLHHLYHNKSIFKLNVMDLFSLTHAIK